jgi:hypothetical protein
MHLAQAGVGMGFEEDPSVLNGLPLQDTSEMSMTDA